MSAPPLLTDRNALLRNRTQRLQEDALFLHKVAARNLQERLIEVNRDFTAPAIVAPFSAVWAEVLPDARILPDEDVLQLDQAAHDLVIHAMSLHWANDPVGQLVQCRRALKPDGLCVVVCFGGQTLHELRAVLAEAEVAATGGLTPRVAPMGDIRDLGALLQRAGFALPVADSQPQTVQYESLFGLAHDLRHMGEGNALAQRHRHIPPRALFADAAHRYADTFPGPDGGIQATFELCYLTGWAPSDSQPKPLRPGSATTRLADALGATERPAGDKADPGRD